MDRRLSKLISKQADPHAAGGDGLDSLLLAMGSTRAAARPPPRAARTVGVGEAVWDPAPPAQIAPQPSVRASATASPALELLRRRAMRRLQAGAEAALERTLGAELLATLPVHSRATLRNGNGLVERWCMCRHLARHLAPDHVHAEPLLPPPYRREAEVPDLARELRDAGAAPAQASKACRQLGLEAQKALQWLVHQPPPTATKVSVGAAAPGVAPGGGGGGGATTMMQVRAGSVALPLTRAHHDKLRELHDRAAARGGGGGDFRGALFSLLLRYDSLGGDGFQAALNANAFGVLRRRFGVDFECFASPLNCRYDRFCSAFADVDAPFGSCGSFFDAFALPPAAPPPEGCYEATPPFVPALVEAMARRMNALLTAADGSRRALGFIVIVPENAAHALPALTESLFLRRTLRAENRRHDYCEGAQHKRARLHRAATCDTAVYFLQSAAAAARWPAVDDACAELLVALSDARPRAADEPPPPPPPPEAMGVLRPLGAAPGGGGGGAKRVAIVDARRPPKRKRAPPSATRRVDAFGLLPAATRLPAALLG